jgi:hypothetical protein
MCSIGRYVSLFVPLAMLSGCAGSVIFGHTIGERPTPAPPVAQPAPLAPPAALTTQAAAVAVAARVRSVSSVAIAVTAAAQPAIAAEARFTRESLLSAVEQELRARGLLDPGAAGGARTLSISIEEFSVRASTNAVILGYSLEAGTLSASLAVRGADQREDRDFRVQAGSRLASRADAGDKDPLRPLFHRFAVLAADALSGVQSKADVAGADAMPR